MKEKLIIKNFGPIKSVELDLGRFNILIGEQATGKSTVAKVLAVCRYFSYIIGDKGSFPLSNFSPSFLDGLKSWGLSEYILNESYIEYSCANYNLVAKNTIIQSRTIRPIQTEFSDNSEFKTKLTPISEAFKNLLFELEKITPKTVNPNSIVPWTIPYSFFSNDVKNVMGNPFFLPTERGLQSFFSLGKGSTENIWDSLYRYFAKMERITDSFKETDIEPLNLVYQNRFNKGFIRKKDEEQFFSLKIAASGYQSAIPIVLSVKYYYEMQKRKKTIIIEEPELNLYPEAQYALMKYLIEKANEHDFKKANEPDIEKANEPDINNSLFIATHSPYILASVNNLLLAGKYGNERVNEVIAEKYWLNINDVSAYKLLPNGECEDIIDKESGQIKAEKIDGASQIISTEYEKIMDIAFS